MLSTTTIQRFLISFAIVTSLGVLIHDSKLDQAATVALALPLGFTLALSGIHELKSEGHTHVERVSFERSAQQNNVPVRNDHRRYLFNRRTQGFNIPELHTLVVDPALS